MLLIKIVIIALVGGSRSREPIVPIRLVLLVLIFARLLIIVVLTEFCLTSFLLKWLLKLLVLLNLIATEFTRLLIRLGHVVVLLIVWSSCYMLTVILLYDVGSNTILLTSLEVRGPNHITLHMCRWFVRELTIFEFVCDELLLMFLLLDHSYS